MRQVHSSTIANALSYLKPRVHADTKHAYAHHTDVETGAAGPCTNDGISLLTCRGLTVWVPTRFLMLIVK